MATKLIGQNYSTADLVAKVTGKAKYAEDFRVDGMLFCKLLTSTMPHARVTRLDTSKALAMPGVRAILTADDIAHAALSLEPGSSAALLIWEDTWAAPFAAAVRNAGGVILEGARIPREIIEQVMGALAGALD